MTALIAACAEGQLSVVQLLLGRGADPNKAVTSYKPPAIPSLALTPIVVGSGLKLPSGVSVALLPPLPWLVRGLQCGNPGRLLRARIVAQA